MFDIKILSAAAVLTKANLKKAPDRACLTTLIN